jgi:hypothetical protein
MTKLRMSGDLALPLDAVTQKIAFIGRTGSGKTYAATKLAELFGEAGAQFVALDPVGKWWSLRLRADGKPSGLDVPVFGGLHGDLPLEPLMGARIADLIVDRQIAAVLDVSQFEHNTDKARFAEAFATRLFYRKKSAPSAIHLFVEESQEFIPQNPQGEERRMLGAFERIVKLGRNFGIGASLISQRPQEVNKKALNQTECLFVFQTTGTHERKAIDAWIADKGIDEDIAALLPSLHVGEARVWSPAWLRVSLTTTIGEKRTFDASATPKVGARKVEVRALTPIDIVEISKSLADVVERARVEDPRELRRRIAELEKQLKAQPAALPQIIEKPVLTNKQVEDLAMVASKLDLLGAQLSNVALDTGRVLKAFDASQRQVSAPGLQWSKKNSADLRPPPASPRPTRGSTQHAIKSARGAGDSLPGGQRRILLALARYGSCSKSKLAILARYASNGGGFNNNLSALRTAMRVVGTDPIEITGDGLAALGGFDPLPEDPDQLFDDWLRHPELGRAHREIMRVLRESDRAMSKEDVAAKCDPPYEAGGGGFNNALSRLRTLGIVEGRSEIMLTEQLRG